MKKFLSAVTVITMLFSNAVPIFASAQYNGQYYENITTKAVSGELMIEARSVFEAMKYATSWDADTKTIVFSNGVNSVNILTATGDITVNGELYQTDVKPLVSDSTTYIPANLLKELGINIDWNYKESYPLLYSSDYVVTTTEITTEDLTESTTEDITEEDEDDEDATDEDEDEDNTDVQDNDTKSVVESSSEFTTEGGVTGWNTAHNEYYFNGSKVTGLQYVDGKMYNFGINGTILTGIVTDENGTRGYDQYGNAYDGFVDYENKKYYFNNGIAYTAPTAIDDKMYNFATDGTLTVGWAENDGSKMYYNEFGYPEDGIIEIDGSKYYFINGVMQTGAVVYGEKNYLFNDDGTMVIDKLVGEMYYGSDGVGVKRSPAYLKLQEKANKIISDVGSDPRSLFNYVVGHVKYKYMAQQDWTTMANTAFNTGRGACYNFTACVDILLKTAGYETRVVRGTGYLTSLHYWNQVKINGQWTNIDATLRHFEVSDSYLKSRNYTFDKYEYPVYY